MAGEDRYEYVVEGQARLVGDPDAAATAGQQAAQEYLSAARAALAGKTVPGPTIEPRVGDDYQRLLRQQTYESMFLPGRQSAQQVTPRSSLPAAAPESASRELTRVLGLEVGPLEAEGRHLAELRDALNARLGSITQELAVGQRNSDAAIAAARRGGIGGTPAGRLPSGGIATFDPSGRVTSILSEEQALAKLVAAESAETAALERQAAAAATDAASWTTLSDTRIRAMQAEREYKSLMADGNSSLTQRENALLRMRQAQRGVDEETRRSQAPDGFLGRFLYTLRGGDRAQGGENAFIRLRSDQGEFLGAIARYQVAYAAIFALSAGFGVLLKAQADAEDELVAFTDAMEVQSSTAQRLASDIGEVGARANQSVASSVAAATRGIYGFGDQIEAGASRQDVGRASTQAAAMGALLTRAQDMQAVQTQIIATTRSFNLGFNEQTRVLDAAANGARNYGGAMQEILAGLPGVAEVAREAGLSIEATANMLSVAIAKSGMSGTGVASLFNRFVGNFNERPDTRQLLESMGVDASGSAGEAIQNLASAWKDLSEAQQQQILTALGGHEVAKALLPILEEGDRLAQKNAKSYENLGLATRLYYEQSRHLGGVLRQIGGDVQVLAYDVANSGIADVFGAALTLVHPLLRGVDELVQAFDLLPRGVRSWALGLAEVLAILVLIGRHQAVIATETSATAAATTVQSTAGLAGLFRRRTPIQAAASEAIEIEGEVVGGVAPRLGRGAAAAAGLRAMGTTLLGPAGVVAGLAGLAIATGGVIEALHNETQARRLAQEAQGQLGAARTADELRSAASALGNAAEEQRHANSGIFGFFVASGDDRRRPGQLMADARYATSEAQRIEDEQSRLSGRGSLGAFFTNTGEWAHDLSAGLTSMQQAGVPAVRQLHLLTQAIDRTSGAAGSAVDGLGEAVYGTETLRNQLTLVITTALRGATLSATDYLLGAGATQLNLPTARTQLNLPRGGPQLNLGGGQPFTPNLPDAQQAFDALGDPAAVRKALQRTLNRLDVNAATVITPDLQREIVEGTIDQLGLEDVLTGKARRRVAQSLRQVLHRQFSAGRAPLPELRSQSDFDAFVQGVYDSSGNQTQAGQLEPYLQALSSTTDPRKIDSGLSVLQGQVGFLRQLVAAARAQNLGGASVARVVELLHSYEHAYVQAEVERLERLRHIATATATSPGGIVAANAHSVYREVRAAGPEDTEALVGILQSTDQATLALVRRHLEADLKLARAALAGLAGEAAALASIPAAVRAMNPEDFGGVDAAVGAARARVQRLKKLIDVIFGGAGLGGIAGGEQDPNELAQAQILAGYRAGDPVAQAQAQRDAAAYAYAHAKNATEKAQALRQLKDADYALTQAVAAEGEAARQASVIPGSALSAAAAQIDVARRQLDAAVPGTAEYYQALGALHEAQYSYMQAVVDYHHNLHLLDTDLSDPLDVAREELRQARARLRHDRARGAGEDTIASDKVALRQADIEKQRTKFDQRLGDIQTAHDLGRMSDSAYLNWLEARDRLLRHELEGMRKGTNGYRLAKEQLDQIDEALKSITDSMSAQWNLGDIDVPTPYEVRRSLATRAGGSGVTTTVIQESHEYHMRFDGTDKQELERILKKILGPSATRRSSTTYRKG